MSTRPATLLRLSSLPPTAQAYVAAVITGGAAVLAVAATQGRFDRLWLFVVPLAVSVLADTPKVELPLDCSQSTFSLSQAITFWALLTLDWTAVVAIAAASSCAQCTLRTSGRNPIHRTLFSIATIVLTVAIVGVPMQLLSPDPASFASVIKAAGLTAPVYFFVN